MGPTNIALVKLLRADSALRLAQGHYDDAAKNVKILTRRASDLDEKLRLAQAKLKEQQAKAGQMELEIKSRDAHIEKLRTQQQTAKTHKEYQTFLTEINTYKVDKGKIEDELLKVMQEAEGFQNEANSLQAQLTEAVTQRDATQAQLDGLLKQLQAEIDRLKPLRDAAAAEVPPKARDAFERLVDRYEGEAMGAVSRPDRRREEYVCTACHMDLVVDIYNRLHSRDDVVFCPSCRRLLYIPDDLPPELAIGRQSSPREKREKKTKDAAAEA